MGKALTAYEVTEVIMDEIGTLPWIVSADISSNKDASENWIAIATKETGYLFTLRIANTKDNKQDPNTCIISTQVDGILDECVFKLEQQVRDHFAIHILPKIMLCYYGMAADAIIRGAEMLNRKLGNESVTWSASKSMTGTHETGRTLVIDYTVFSFSYPDSEDGVPVFMFNTTGRSLVLDAQTLSDNFAEISALVNNRMIESAN